jgi:uncharacterized protein (TIGR02145 family)
MQHICFVSQFPSILTTFSIAENMKTIKIGNQVWTKKNLRVFKFRNEDIIPIVQDYQEWSKMTSAAMCINPDNGECYYNWYAVIDPKGLAPEGFHVASDEEWDELVNHLGGNTIAGQDLKSQKKWDGLNFNGFSGLPAGYRDNYGSFYGVGSNGGWWSSSPSGGNSINRYLTSKCSNVYRSYDSPHYGFSVRLIQD